MDPFSALSATKVVLRRAGKAAEKEALAKECCRPEVRMQLILQVARAIASQILKDLPVLQNIVEVGPDDIWILDQGGMGRADARHRT